MQRALNICIKFISRLPFGMLYFISDMLFWPVYYVVRYRREVVRRNLTECFPEKSEREIKKIEKEFYHHLIDTFLEAMKLATISPGEMKRRMHFTNIDEVVEILKSGKSISAYLGHYCNWEWMSACGMWFNTYSRCMQVYHKQSNQQMDALMTELRERFGNKCIEMMDTVRTVAGFRRDNPEIPLILGLIADQSPKHMFANHFLEFLNHRIPMLTGTEKMTKHFDFAAMFVRVRPVKRGYYEAEFIMMQPETKDIPDYQLTEQYIKLLENEIYDKPEYYLWSHNRFKYADPVGPLRGKAS